MIRWLAALVLAALWLAGCGSPPAPPGPPWPDPAPALWQVQDEHGARGWLFGTIHALPAGIVWRTPALDAALAESRLILVEIARPGDPAAAALFARLSRREGASPVPLAERVAPADREALAGLLQAAGAAAGDLAQTRTWAAALQLANMARANQPALGVDRAILALAAERSIAVEGLESHVSQFATFGSLSEPAQIALLMAVAREVQHGDADASTRAWLAGDLEQLETRLGTGVGSHPELFEQLVARRNRRFAEAFLAALRANRDRPVLLAVGTGHMLGDQGIPALLAARGLRISRVQ